jgi:CDP-6-deoxy-D-xylo-4-hexulose-3-dehydrase
VNYELASSSWGPEELAAMQRVIDSGRFTMGENVGEFERRFAGHFGSRHALMVSSGSMANLVGVAALSYRTRRPLQRGDEVIVPAISWATTYYPLQQYGLRLRFLDVDLHTLNMDVTQLEAALTPRTRMVMAVSILGNPAELGRMREFCDAHDLILFEDNCESMGARLDGRYTGTFGDVGTFSTFFSHHISTMEGGVLVTDDDDLYHVARCLRAHGWTRDVPPESGLYAARGDDFFEAYRFILPGYNARPLEIAGAVGVEQLRKLDGMIGARRRNAAHFVALFRDDPRFMIQREHGASSWFAFTLVLHPRLAAARRLVLAALRSAGIEFRIVTGGCFTRHDVIRHFDFDTLGSLPNANLIHDQGFFVGNHPRDLRGELDLLRRTLDDCLGPVPAARAGWEWKG